MKYTSFSIENYRAIKGKVTIDVASRIIPLVGVNECGKTTILQAIFCFDSINDAMNNGQHLKDINNLYSTVSEGDCIISANIACTRDEINKCVQAAARAKEKSQQTPAVKTSTAVTEVDTSMMDSFIEQKDKISSVTISRNLSKGRKYSSPLFDDFSVDDENLICKHIIAGMPYILYNDDFNDRPISEVSLDTNEDDDANGWYDIFERVFNSTNSEYSLKTIAERDDRIRKSILSDVEDYLSTTLTDAWSKFSPVKKDISISLDVDTDKKLLQVFIKEQIKGQSPKYFSVTDRSKGFIWYYNFIMKIRFNPKQSGASKETVFLLDEPGSYLHETAQADLCKKLKDISKKEGIVIYCTHSPQLISPSYVPLNNILIVEKDKSTRITVESVATKNSTQSVRNTAMQPIYEALQIPEFKTILDDEKILCVEGIYDKYCIECFCALPKHIRVFPSVSADSVINNIQYFIAYQKDYLALWDNDDEGKRSLGKAKSVFGLKESEHFTLLPDVHKHNKVRMEEMIEPEDHTFLKQTLKLPPNATYETVVSELYYLKSVERKRIVSSVSAATKNSFAALKNIISKHLG